MKWKWNESPFSSFKFTLVFGKIKYTLFNQYWFWLFGISDDHNLKLSDVWILSLLDSYIKNTRRDLLNVSWIRFLAFPALIFLQLDWNCEKCKSSHIIQTDVFSRLNLADPKMDQKFTKTEKYPKLTQAKLSSFQTWCTVFPFWTQYFSIE